jgi:anti-sigma factor RsiW
VTLRSTVFGFLGLLLTGAASLWLLAVTTPGQRLWVAASHDQLTAVLGYAGAAGAIMAGMSALAVALSVRERGPVRAFSVTTLVASALFVGYIALGGLV